MDHLFASPFRSGLMRHRRAVRQAFGRPRSGHGHRDRYPGGHGEHCGGGDRSAGS